MHTAPANSLNIILEGLNLEKYSGLFEEKRIRVDTFVNMIEDDLIYIGISDEADRKTILQGVESMKSFYREINEMEPPNLEAILSNNLEHLKGLLGSIIHVKKKLRKSKPQNVLLDSTHSASSVILLLLDKIDDELSYLKEDLIPERVSRPRKNSSFRIYYAVGCLTAVAFSSFILFKFIK